MAELPKYLGYSFEKEISKEILSEIESKIIGEEPTALEDDVDGKIVTYYLVSIENQDNKELLQLLNTNEADIFTCYYDMELEDGDFIDKQPFAQLQTEEDEIEVTTDTDNFIYDTLNLKLETDIFKNVDDAESNDLYETFAKEQSAITIQFQRITKDLLAYSNDDLMKLVANVEQQLQDSSLYNKLKEQEKGLEILVENNQDKIAELEDEFEDQKTQLGKKLTNLILEDNKKEIAITQKLLKDLDERINEQKEALLERQKEALAGNKRAIDETKYHLTKEIIDTADKLVSYDFEALYNYEQRYKEARNYVKNYFSVDKIKEREDAERLRKAKEEALQKEKARQEQEKLEVERRRKELEERRKKEEEERLAQQKQQEEELEKEQEIEEEDSTSSTSTDEATPIQNLNFKQGLAQAIQNNNSTPQVSEKSKENADEDEQEDFDINDTIQRKGKSIHQVSSVNEDELLNQVSKIDDTVQTEKKKSVNFFMKHKIAIISGVLGLIAIGYVSVSLSNATNSNAKIEEAKVTKSSKKTSSSSKSDSEEKSSESTSSSNGEALSSTLYKENVNILKDSGLGMYLDDDDNLTGTFKVKNQNGEQVLRYVEEYTKDGRLITRDQNGDKITYDKEWVDNFINQIVNSKSSSESGN